MLAAVTVAAGLHTAMAGPVTPSAREASGPQFGWRDRSFLAHATPSAGWGRTRLLQAATSNPAATGASSAAAAARPGPAARMRPVEGAITGAFGEPRASGPHPGVDLDGETGDPIKAAAAGMVLMAGPAAPGWGGYGTIVLIDHGNGVQSLYAHLSAVSVAPGQAVAPGTLVGAMGTTGFVTGSHLHFEVRLNGRPIDPLAWLATPAS